MSVPPAVAAAAGGTSGARAITCRALLARVDAGTWQPRRAFEPADEGVTWRFDQYATEWLMRWSAGALGEDKLDDSTIRLVRDWALRQHLLPALGGVLLDDEHFTKKRLTNYKAQLLARHEEIERLRKAGHVLRRPDGRPEKAVQALDPDHPARPGPDPRRGGRGRAPVPPRRAQQTMRVRAPNAIRTWLQPDELNDLLDAAALTDPRGYSPVTDRVLALHEEGHAIAGIARAVGVSVPTVSYHLGKPRPDAGRVGETRSLLTLLGYAGPRIGEALILRNRDVRLHAEPRRLDILDSKTPTGIREVDLSPQLAEVLVLYRTGAAATGDPLATTISCGLRTTAGRAATRGR
jgi:integrase